jgi:hypothetical protein
MHPRKLLLRILGSDAPTASDWRLSNSAWERLVNEAADHGLAPMLHHRIRSIEGEFPVPAPTARRLQGLSAHSELRNRSAYAALVPVLQALENARVDVLLLKGAFLAQCVYSDPALRPMADIDLLVRRDQLASSERVLRSMGYERAGNGTYDPTSGDRCHLPAFIAPAALPIELHWSLVRPSCASIDFERLWGSAQAAEVAGIQVFGLSEEHLLHHLCLHVSCHHRFRVPLLQLYDVFATLRHFRDLDWHRLADIAECHGTKRFLYVVLSLVRRAFSADHTCERLGLFRGESSDEAIALAAWKCLMGPLRQEYPRYRMEPRVRETAERPDWIAADQHGSIDDSALAASLVPQSMASGLGQLFGFLRVHGLSTARILVRRLHPRSLTTSRSWADLDRWTHELRSESIPPFR